MMRFLNNCHSKLSVTGDTAKYLVLILCRGCGLFPQDSVNPFFHDAHFARMVRWRVRRDLSEAIPQTNPDTLHPTNTTTLCLSSWVFTASLVKTEPIWLVAALKASWLKRLQSLCSWVAVLQVRYTRLMTRWWWCQKACWRLLMK
jgi:hypothetical protein